ncbi:VN1R1 protein, partial [Atractosteus spatula]|nr:VN1R1 protein [Atractosteus spatula]
FTLFMLQIYSDLHWELQDLFPQTMEVRLMLKAVGFICLDAVGIPGNLGLLLFFCSLRHSQCGLPPSDLVLGNLVFVNLVVVLCRGIPQALTALGVRSLLVDPGCKAVIFAYRMGRAMSICVTSLLSCYQCVVIAPPGSRGWTRLKSWLPHRIPHMLLLLYGLNVAIYPAALLYSSAATNSSLSEYTLNLEFCVVAFPSFEVYMGNGVMYIVRDFIFVGMMASAGGYIVVILYRHRKQTRGLQGADRTQRKTVEASKAVLTLIAIYVILFGLDNVLWIYTLCVSRVHPIVTDTRVFFASCYSALSPVFIITTNKKIAASLSCCKGKDQKLLIAESTVSHLSPGQ